MEDTEPCHAPEWRLLAFPEIKVNSRHPVMAVVRHHYAPMHPKPPSHINHVTRRCYIDGSPMCYQILDEIIHIPRSNRGKAIYLQLLRFEDDGRDEMRLCYYMIGHRGRTKGKWVYAQFAPMIRKQDFDHVISKA